MIKNIFDKNVTGELIARIDNLQESTAPQWGKMNVGQMLAHCCVPYELIYENHHPMPGTFKKILLRWFVKGMVVSAKPYKKNSPTSPEFLVKENKDFEAEKERLINYLVRTRELGEAHFDGKAYRSFGKLSVEEWNNMLYKHIDHHLTQFGV